MFGLYTEERLIERWLSFHKKKPEFYPLFCEVTIEYIMTERRFSAARVFEEIKDSKKYAKVEGQPFGVLDQFTSLYARKFMHDYPQYGKAFWTKKLTAVTEEELLILYSN